jgi:N-acetyl-gamma-glutamyl-phosphate reductase
MALRAAIAGTSGYAGGELVRLLLGHPHLTPAVLAANRQAGGTLGAVHAHLTPLADQPLVPTEAEVLAAADVVFLALPHGESAAIVAALDALAPDLPVVDLGADFRLRDARAWQQYYAGRHAGAWPYGLPELPGHRDLIAGSRRIANPGCYATSVALALGPLLAAGVVRPDDVVVVAASGTSGAGRTMSPTLAASEVLGSMSGYKVGGAHQHTPEMEQSLSTVAGEPVTLSFTPTLAPMARGILATCTARLADGVGAEVLRAAMYDAYVGELFVTLMPEGNWPRTADVLGSNAAHVQVAADVHAGRAVVQVAIDNLGKGAAGQAIQNANLVLGLPESAGLTTVGIAP